MLLLVKFVLLSSILSGVKFWCKIHQTCEWHVLKDPFYAAVLLKHSKDMPHSPLQYETSIALFCAVILLLTENNVHCLFLLYNNEITKL